MSEQYYITTPLYYVNNEPHVGHAYTTILADVLSRYNRHFGRDVHFLTGLDEHGQKVADAAAKRNLPPEEHCNAMAEAWKGIWEQLGIQYDDFIRTTEARHQEVVIRILNYLYEKGDIYHEEYEGWYSVFEERFFTEKDLVDGMDPIGGRAVERLREKNYFFRMSKYQDWLIDHYERHPDAVIPSFRLNEVKGFLKQPLGDLCISRPKSRLKWGIPIPWDDEYVTYVWFDALLNYYTATVTPPEGKTVQWPADYHLIAKDILTTHAVYWPTMLHAAGFEPPRHILAHGYWLAKDDAKMSKSIGNVVHPLELSRLLGTDAFRYVLMREMVLGQDASFSLESFVNRINTDLANDLGNLYSRLAKVWQTGKYGEAAPSADAPDAIPVDLVKERAALAVHVRAEMDQFKPQAALDAVMSLVRGLNRLIEQLKPWITVKTDPESIRDELCWAIDTLRDISEILEPVMPGKMAELKARIQNGDVNQKGIINPVVGKPLFPRIQIKDLKQESKHDTAKNKAGSEKPSVSPEISIDDFKNVELRVGRILSARKHEGADKLLVLKVDLGTEERQIVAGIAKSYTPEELIGKNVVVVANLKPVKLRGELSQGMVLAAVGSKSLNVVTFDREVAPGTRIS